MAFRIDRPQVVRSDGRAYITVASCGIDRLRLLANQIHIREIRGEECVPLTAAIGWYSDALVDQTFHETYRPAMRECLERLQATEMEVEG